MNENNFRERAENAGAEDFYDDGSQEFRISEDDGNFFVEQDGIRACFYIGQESSRSHFNAEANRILRRLGRSERYNGSGIV